MLAKELLVKNGFTTGRGRRSVEQIDFLNKYLDSGGVLEDYTNKRQIKSASKQIKAQTFSAIHKVRDENTIRIVDSEGFTYVLDFHSLCGKSIRQCSCKNGPQPPHWLKAESWSLQNR